MSEGDADDCREECREMIVEIPRGKRIEINENKESQRM